MKKPDPEASAPSEGGQITSSFYSRASLPTLPFFGGGLSWTGWAGVCQREMAHAFPLLNKKKIFSGWGWSPELFKRGEREGNREQRSKTRKSSQAWHHLGEGSQSSHPVNLPAGSIFLWTQRWSFFHAMQLLIWALWCQLTRLILYQSPQLLALFIPLLSLEPGLSWVVNLIYWHIKSKGLFPQVSAASVISN